MALKKLIMKNFKIISVAILKHNILNFNYKEKSREVKPYKLLNYQGIWYLIADEKDKLKHFTFSKIKNIRKNDEILPLKKNFRPNSK